MSEENPKKRAKFAHVERRSSVEVFGEVLLGYIKPDKALIRPFLEEHAFDGETVKVKNETFFPLILAIAKKNHDLATMLVEDFSANPKAFPGTCEAILTIVCSTTETNAKSDDNLIRFLLSHGANPEYQGTENMTALHVCASIGALRMAKTLAPAMNDINPRDHKGRTPLHLALVNQENEELVRVLLEHGADPNLPTGDGLLPLLMASVHNHLSYTKILIEFGANTELQNERGKTALAMVKRHHQAASLLELGCRGDTQDRNGVCPLHTLFRLWDHHNSDEACGSQSFEPILVRLIALSCNLNPKDSLGRTPLHRASEVSSPCSLAFIKKLLQAGTSNDTQDRNGWTPLHAAVAAGNVDAIRCLLDSGADVDKRDSQGRSPLHLLGLHALAEQSKSSEQDSRARLLAFGSSGMMPTKDYGDSFPFTLDYSKHPRSSHDILHASITNLLLSARANVLSMDRERNLPFAFACQAHCDTSVYIMVRRAAVAGLFPDHKSKRTRSPFCTNWA